MKKRIFAILLVVLTLSMNIISYAVVLDGANIDENTTTQMAYNYFISQVPSYSDYYWCGYTDNANTSSVEHHIYFTPKDCVLVRSSEVNAAGYYEYNVYSYDFENSLLVEDTFDIQILSRKNYMQYKSSSLDGVVLYADGLTSRSDYVANIPICANEEYALLYFSTLDYGYVENGGQFVDVPEPEDVAIYEVSGENGIYLYWENTSGLSSGVDVITDITDKTSYIEYGYYYQNVDGNYSQINADDLTYLYNVNYLYCRRGQFFISLEDLEQYENGFVEGCIYNVWYSSVMSGKVRFQYYISNGQYAITYEDENGNILKENWYSANDYVSKNDSFTGGARPTDKISGSSDGNYDILSYLFNGFGLVGDNGALKMIGDTFSFIPQPIIVLLIAFVSIAIVIALFKLVIH